LPRPPLTWNVSRTRMLDDLSLSQRALADYISDLSEEAYCAGWMQNVEYALWQAVRGERSSFGRLIISGEQVRRLEDLSRECEGWIFFDDHNEESWLPTSQWEQRFDAWLATRAQRPLDD